MSWGAHDDHLDDDPRWWGLPLAAAGLYWSVLPYCLRERKNLIPSGLPARFQATPAESQALMDAGLWVAVEGGWAYPDTDWEAMTMPEKREHSAVGGRARAATAQREGGRFVAKSPAPSQRVSSESPATSPAMSSLTPTPSPTPTPLSELVPSSPVDKGLLTPPRERPRVSSTPVQVVYDTWKAADHRNGNTALTDERRKAVEKALKLYPLEDVIDAALGLTEDHWRMENSRTDLKYLMRDFEVMRDVHRGVRPARQQNVGPIERDLRHSVASGEVDEATFRQVWGGESDEQG